MSGTIVGTLGTVNHRNETCVTPGADFGLVSLKLLQRGPGSRDPKSGGLSSISSSSRKQLTPQNRHRLTRQSDAFAVQPNLQDPAALGELMRDEAVFPEAFAPEWRQGAVC